MGKFLNHECRTPGIGHRADRRLADSIQGSSGRRDGFCRSGVSLAAPFVKFRETMKEIKNRIREGIVQQDLDDLGRRDS
jgi:hypothetical protein